LLSANSATDGIVFHILALPTAQAKTGAEKIKLQAINILAQTGSVVIQLCL